MIKVGEKVKGFRFNNSSGVNYFELMDECIGMTGTITYINHSNIDVDHFQIYFGRSKSGVNHNWTYPVAEYLAIQRELKLKELGL